jgi:hypothetical protein
MNPEDPNVGDRQLLQELITRIAVLENQNANNQAAIEQEGQAINQEAAAINQVINEQQNLRQEIQHAVPPVQAGAPQQQDRIKVGEFHGERGAAYRIWKNQLQMKFRSAQMTDEMKLAYLVSRCFGPAGELVRLFTDPTHLRYNQQGVDQVIPAMDDQYQVYDVSYAANDKIDRLCSRPNLNYASYLKRFIAQQDQCNYNYGVLKQRFVRGLPAEFVIQMLARLDDHIAH